MGYRHRRLTWRHLWLASLAAACAGGFTVATDARAAPGDLRVLDPKTGLPKTWDSRVGRTPPPGNGRAGGGIGPVVKPRAPGATVDPCMNYDHKTSCSDPGFAARCPNAAASCKSWKELSACVASSPAGADCGTPFYNAHKAELEAVPKARRIVPSRRSLGGESRPMGLVKYDPSKVKVGGMDHAFATRLAHPAVRTLMANAPAGRAPKLTNMQAALKKLPRVAQLSASGDVSGLIDSCDEYAARKYLSLTQFDDAVSAQQRDPRKVYDMLYNSGNWAAIVQNAQVRDSEQQPSTTAPTASEDVLGNIIVTPGAPLSFLPIKEPRNSFLQVASGFSRTFYDPNPYQANRVVPRTFPFPSLGLPDYSSSPAITAAIADYQKKSEVFFNHELFTRRPFTAKDNPTVNETFAWHQQKNNQLWEADTEDKPGRYTDEELRIRYDRQKDLRALLARRGEISDFITNVGTICRKQTEPPPLPPPDLNTLNKLAANLTKFAAKLKADPNYSYYQAQTYYNEADPVFVQAGISKGWEITDPIGGAKTNMVGPSVQNVKWAVQYAPNSEYGPYVFYGLSCRSQLGCPARPVLVTSGEVESKASEVLAKIATLAQYLQELPKINSDRHAAFQRTAHDAEVKCTGFGITSLFASTGVPADPNAILIAPPTLSAGEAAAVAKALQSNVLPKLEAVDALVSEQLGAGIELGCFGSGQNGCDWSPNRLIDFSHAYRKEMDKAREADAQRCARYTTHDKSGFTYKAKLNDLMKSKGYDWNKSRKTVKGFEALLLDAEQEAIKQLKDEISAIMALQAYDDDGKTPALGQITSTDGSFGSDLFGAEYGAGGGFRFGSLSTDKNGNFSPTKVTSGPDFTYWAGNYATAAVKILGTTNEVFNARMDIALTNGRLLDLQQGATPTDKKYLTGGVSGGRDYLGEKNGIKDTFNAAHAKAQGAEKNRIVQGHLHFRVVGDDLFEPINHTVQPTVYASTEPLYKFEPASYDKTLFDESTTITIVIVPVTIRGWATFHAGVNYTISAALDRPNVDSEDLPSKKPINRTPFQLSNVIEPYAQIDGNVSVAIGVPGLEVGVKGSLTLIRMGLPYHSNAQVQFFDGGGNIKKSAGNRFAASQGLDFTLSSLSGTVSGFVEILLWSAEAELFHWDGITSDTPIFAINEVDANVARTSDAVRLMAPGFKVDQ